MPDAATTTSQPALTAIEVCGGDYEHVLGLGEGGDVDAGIRYRRVALGELGRRVLDGGDFDAAEYSLANAIILRDRGDERLTVLPVFPSRAFRNASVFVAQDSPLRDLRALVGKRVGISDFAMTTAVWTRGHLHDDLGLDWRSIEWTTGPKPRFAPPPGVRATPTGEDLEAMLLDGRIDALMTGKPRDLQQPPALRRLRPLADDTEAIERRYYTDTGLYPIMHTVVLHARVAQQPGAARRVFDAYARAKQAALKRKLGATLLPFAEREWERLCPPGAEDPYRYGLGEANRRNIATLSRYLLEQGFIRRLPDLESLFAPGSAQWEGG